eukprot:COSAG02_NODE_39259_length_419_cov_0.809375_1_plen_133_part_01
MRLRASGGSSSSSKGDQAAAGAQATVNTARIVAQAAAPPGGVWEKCYDGGVESSQADSREGGGDEDVKVHLSATGVAQCRASGDMSDHGTPDRARANDGTSTIGGGDTSLPYPPAVSEVWGQDRDTAGEDDDS